MLKDAGLFLLELNTELAKDGLTLSSANPWSVLFEGCRPVLVDFCDIVPLEEDGRQSWERFQKEFYIDFIYPLRLMAEGKPDLARWILAEYEHQEVHEQFAALMHYRYGRPASSTFSKMWSRIHGILQRHRKDVESSEAATRAIARLQKTVMDGLQRLRRETDRIRFALPRPAPPDEGTELSRELKALLAELKPQTIFMAGCGREWYTRVAASSGANVIAIDRAERKVHACYAGAKRDALSVHPLVMNFCFPTPGFGIANASLPPATERLACDVVVALNLVHHLVLEQARTFEQVVEGLASFTTRWAVVEFALPHDLEVSPGLGPQKSWYSLESFLSALRQRFRVQRVASSHPDSRVIVVCEKKES
jgi:hypothetical protein